MGILGKCPFCGKKVDRSFPGIRFPHFIYSEDDPLWNFSERCIHFKCLDEWQDKDKFLSRWFEAEQGFASYRESMVWTNKNILVSWYSAVKDIILNIRQHLPPLRFKENEIHLFISWLSKNSEKKSLTLSYEGRSQGVTFDKEIGDTELVLKIQILSWDDFIWDMPKKLLDEVIYGLSVANEAVQKAR